MSEPDSAFTEKPATTANDGAEARRRLRLGVAAVRGGQARRGGRARASLYFYNQPSYEYFFLLNSLNLIPLVQ